MDLKQTLLSLVDVLASGISQASLLRLLGDQALSRMGMVWTPNTECPVFMTHGHSTEVHFSSQVCISLGCSLKTSHSDAWPT